jgi:hypothetical protein
LPFPSFYCLYLLFCLHLYLWLCPPLHSTLPLPLPLRFVVLRLKAVGRVFSTWSVLNACTTSGRASLLLCRTTN